MAMKKRSISLSLKRGSPNRFLRPGALARIRDSKLISLAVQHKSVPIVFIAPPPSPPRQQQTDGSPCFFARRVSGPSFLQRKKLSASKYVIFVPSSPIQDLESQAVDLFGSDMVAAH